MAPANLVLSIPADTAVMALDLIHHYATVEITGPEAAAEARGRLEMIAFVAKLALQEVQVDAEHKPEVRQADQPDHPPGAAEPGREP